MSPELFDAGLVGPEAAASEQRGLVKPDQVAALGGSRLLDGSDHGDVQALVEHFVEGRFRATQRLGGAQDDRAVWRHEGGVEDEDRVRKSVVRGRDPLDLGARPFDVMREEVVLVSQPGGVRTVSVVPEFRIGLEGRAARTAHRDAAQGGHHGAHAEVHRGA